MSTLGATPRQALHDAAPLILAVAGPPGNLLGAAAAADTQTFLIQRANADAGRLDRLGFRDHKIHSSKFAMINQ